MRSRNRKIRRVAPGMVRKYCGPVGPFDRVEWNTSRGAWASWGLWLEWRVTGRTLHGFTFSLSGSTCIGAQA